MAMDGKVGDHATHDPLRSLKLHSSTSRERYGKPTAKKVDLFAVGMVMAKQYNTTHVKIRRKVNVKMLRNIGIFRSLSENLLKKLADEFLTKSYHTSDKIIKQNNYGEKLFILLHGVIGIHVEGVGLFVLACVCITFVLDYCISVSRSECVRWLESCVSFPSKKQEAPR